MLTGCVVGRSHRFTDNQCQKGRKEAAAAAAKSVRRPGVVEGGREDRGGRVG